jgi:hypothetical protein
MAGHSLAQGRAERSQAPEADLPSFLGESGKKLAVLHRHCHDVVHGPGTNEPPRSIRDRDYPREEPYECESLTYGSEDQPGGRPPG